MIQSVTIGGTINLENYESLRLDVCADTPEEAISTLRQCLIGCAIPGSVEYALINRWISRVLGTEIPRLQPPTIEAV